MRTDLVRPIMSAACNFLLYRRDTLWFMPLLVSVTTRAPEPREILPSYGMLL